MVAEHGSRFHRGFAHGFDETVFKPPQRPRNFDGNRKIRVGFISRFYVRRVKGEPYLVDLLKRLDPRSYEFLFVGGGRWREAEIARGLGFQATFHEHLPYALFGLLYDAMDVLLITSQNEGGPASLPEAVASAIPIICNPVGMCADLVIEGQNGMFLSGDADDDANSISRLTADDGSLMRRLFGGAYDALPTVSSWSRVSAQHFDIYRRVARNG